MHLSVSSQSLFRRTSASWGKNFVLFFSKFWDLKSCLADISLLIHICSINEQICVCMSNIYMCVCMDKKKYSCLSI